MTNKTKHHKTSNITKHYIVYSAFLAQMYYNVTQLIIQNQFYFLKKVNTLIFKILKD